MSLRHPLLQSRHACYASKSVVNRRLQVSDRKHYYRKHYYRKHYLTAITTPQGNNSHFFSHPISCARVYTVSATARALCNALQQGALRCNCNALQEGANCLPLLHVRPWLCQRRLQLSTHTPTCFKQLTGPIPDRHWHVHQLGCADHGKCHCRHPACILLLTSLVEQPSGSHVAITCSGFRIWGLVVRV